MKGHSEIILTDVNTGEVEVHSDDNMITNAIRDFWAYGGLLCPTAFGHHESYSFPSNIATDNAIKYYGGLLLFDTQLEEDPNNYIVPAGVGMTGNGMEGYVSNDEITEIGSYNIEESGWLDDKTLKMVWDFSTSQANGKIACACLTSRVNGFIGAGNAKSKKRKTLEGYYSIMAAYYGQSIGKVVADRAVIPIRIKDNKMTYIPIDQFQPLISNKTLDIVTAAFPIDKISILDRTDTYREFSRKTVEVPESICSKFVSWYQAGTTSRDVWVDGDNTYILCQTFSWDKGLFTDDYPIQILKIDKNDNTEWIVINPSNTGIDYRDGENWRCIGVNNHIIIMHIQGYAYKINLDNIADITEVAVNGNPVDSVVTYHSLANVVYRGDNQVWTNCTRVDFVRNAIDPINESDGIYNPITMGSPFNKLFVLSGPSSSFTMYRFNGYLATINNLDNEVTKTADKTMKVIYTLTFDEQEDAP